MATDPAGASPSPAAVKALLGVAALGLAGTLVFAVAWWLGRGGPSAGGGVGDVARLAALSATERQALLEDLLEISPGLYVPAWYEPAIGYTLLPDARLTAWGTTFTTNSLGYRTGPPEKAPGTLRVLFVGDSWTFGMGVAEAQSFPAQLARLARLHGGEERPVEAWSLALPGYNLANQLAAVDFFWRRLEADAVVVAPTPNDADSTAAVLPNGSLGRTGLFVDTFDPPEGALDTVTENQNLAFRTGGFVDSHLFWSRWRRSFERLAALDRRLGNRGVPLVLFFTGTWQEPHAHRLVAEGGLEAPYVVTPPELSVGPWRNPPPVRHPTPAAHHLYARMLYRALAPALGWAELPPPAEDLEGAARADARPVHGSGDDRRAGEREIEASRRLAVETTEREIPTSFRPGTGRAREAADRQAVAPLDPATGTFGRATTVLVRRPEGATGVRVTLAPLADAAALYPLEAMVRIPSPAGGVTRSVTIPVPGDGTDGVTVELPLPDDLPPGAALDVVVTTARSSAAPDVLAGRSARLVAVETY